jgi:hypothetical protein
MKHKFTALLVTATMLLGLASASQADLTIFPQESSTEINSHTSYEVEVENIGPVKDVYEIQHNYPGEISVAPGQVELRPGQSETVNVWFDPNKDRSEGRYGFRIDAVSRAENTEYSTKGYVTVIHDYKTELDVSTTSQSVCRGDTATYDVEVTNEGIQDDTIEITSEVGDLSQNRLTLSPDQSREVELTVSSDEAMEENFQVKAASTRVSYSYDTADLYFRAEPCFQSEVEVTPQSQETAAYTEAEYKVTVGNTGTRADEFELSTNRGEIEDEELEVSAKSERTTTLTYTPTNLQEQEIQVTSEGNSESTSTVTVNPFNGMNSEVTFEESNTVCRGETETYTATVENTGEAEEQFNLTANTGELSEPEVTLEPGEDEEVEVEVNSEGMEDGEHTVELESTATTFEQPTSTGTSTHTIENCWNVDINTVPNVASAGENMSTIYEINLENTGTRENTYELEHSGPSWIEIKPKEVTVQPGQTKTSYMYAGAPFEKKGEIEITAVAEGTGVRKTDTVTLVMNEDVEEAIRSDAGGLTGKFTNSISGLYQSVMESDNMTRGLVAIIAGLVITVIILVREW